jgi:hypothetical protein
LEWPRVGDVCTRHKGRPRRGRESENRPVSVRGVANQDRSTGRCYLHAIVPTGYCAGTPPAAQSFEVSHLPPFPPRRDQGRH